MDTIAPAVAITTIEGGDNIINAAEAAGGIQISGTAEIGSSLTVNGAAVTVDGTGHWTTSVTPAGQGALAVTAVATDAAGNSASTSTTLTVDTIAPAVAITTIEGGDNIINAAEAAGGIQISGTAEIGSSLTVNGAAVTVDGTGHWTTSVTPAGQGALVVTAVATDAAGNAASTSTTLTVDTIAPAVAITTIEGGDNIINAAEAAGGIQISGTAEIGSSLTVNGAAVTVDGTGHWTTSVTPAGQGALAVTAVATDAAGNSATTSTTLTVDTIAPTGGTPDLVAASDSGVSSTDNITDVTAPSFTIALNPTVAAGDTVQLLLSGSPLAHPVSHTITAAEVTAGSVSLAVTAGDLGADGGKSISAQFSDAAGNTSTTAALTITLDTIAPTVAITSTGGPVNQAVQTISGTGEAGTTITLSDNGSQLQLPTITVDQNGLWSASVTLANGSNSLTASDTDAAGNTGSSSAVIYTLGQFTIQWTGQSGGNWSTTSNWDTGILPGAQDDVLINPSVTVTFNTGSSTINQLTTGAGTALTIAGGTMAIAANSSVGGLLTISAGTLTANGFIVAGGLNQSGGLLNGSGTLTVTGLSTLSGVSNYSTESGSGTTIAQGGATFSGSLFGLDGGRTLQLGGASTATGAGAAIDLNNINPSIGSSDAGSGTLTIASGATFNDQTTGSGLTISAPSRGGTDTGVTAAVNNLGTFTKSGAATTSTISTLFNNSGIVNVTSGTLDLSGGGTDVGATYEGSGTVQFGGGTRTLDATSSITAASAIFSGGTTTINGTYNVSGTTTVNGGTATLAGTLSSLGNALVISSGMLSLNTSNAAVATLAQTSGLLNGSGTLTVTGLSTLSGVSNYSTESGSGTTIAQGGATFSGSLFGLDGGRTLQLGGASTATGAGAAIDLNNINPSIGSSDAGSGTLTIASGATFNDQTTGSGLTISAPNRGGTDTGVTAAVNNLGTFTKSGAATTSTISTLFNNSGIVNVTSGTLDLSGGGTDVGASYEGSGTVQFGGGTRTLDATSSITAANAIFSGGTTTINGTYNVSGTTTVNGGTATLAGTLSSLGNALVISSGTLSLNTSNAAVATLAQTSGLLNGSGTLTVTGLSTLSGVSNYSTESGSGTTIAQGGAAFSGSLFGLDGGRTLQLGGASTATGAGAGSI